MAKSSAEIKSDRSHGHIIEGVDDVTPTVVAAMSGRLTRGYVRSRRLSSATCMPSRGR